MWKDKTIRVTVIIGVITILATILIAVFAEKNREPVYSIINSPSLIYDKENASPKIKLVLDDSILVKDNVYVTTLALWNKGKLPIQIEDIRKDLYIKGTGNVSQVLDYKIVRENEAGISNFRLTPVGDSLRINWDHFDPDYGCLVQLIYTGTKDTKLEINGAVLGSKVRMVHAKTENSVFYIVAFFFIIVVILFSIFSFFTVATGTKRKSRLILLATVTVMYTALAIYWFFKYKNLMVAFGVPF